MNKNTRKVLFSSKSDEHITPTAFFNKLEERYGKFTVDAAASHINTKCDRCFTEIENGLGQSWEGHKVFCNPPYTKGQIREWLEKAIHEVSNNGCKLAVFLIPARTDTKYWHELCFRKAEEILFVKGRIKFEVYDEETHTIRTQNPAPFPSAVIVFRQGYMDSATKYGTMEK